MPRAAALAALLALAGLAPCHAGSSNSLMDVSPDGKRLLVANADNGTVSVVDLKTRKAVHEIPVGDKPEGVTWVGTSSIAAVTVYRDDRVVFLDADAGKVVHTLDVSDEPYGIVALKDGSRAYVTHEYPGKVAEIDLKTRKVLREIDAGKMPRGIALAPDEKRLYVTEFYTGVLHAIDLEKGKVVDSWKGHTTDNLARHVVVHPKRPKAYVTHIRSKVAIAHGNGSIFPQLSVCDLVDPKEKGGTRRSSIGLDNFNGIRVVCNSWESAVSPDGERIYMVYAGTDDMNYADILDDNFKEIKRLGGLVSVGKNPRAVRVSPDGKEVYISNALDFTVGVYSAHMRHLDTITVCKPPKSPDWVRGKYLFNTARSPMTSARWIACSSCHPDGHSDGRVWKNPEGLRRTPPMFGLAHTHPLHYSADRDEVQDFEFTIKSALMRGAGFLRIPRKVGFKPIELDTVTGGKNKDLDAIAIYSNSFEFTLSPHAPKGKLSDAAARGKKLFFDKTVGCATCHSGPYYSDSTLTKPYKLHNVGTGGDPDEKMGPKYDTPTLLGLYRAAPFLHHGKAATLMDVLTTQNKGDRHGKTSHLKKEQLEDMVEFLKALPYEKPPSETPNTVKDRFVPAKRKEQESR